MPGCTIVGFNELQMPQNHAGQCTDVLPVILLNNNWYIFQHKNSSYSNKFHYFLMQTDSYVDMIAAYTVFPFLINLVTSQ